MSMKKNSTTNGFTLIESLIAITILTFAVAGPLFTASRVIVATETASDQLTALYLAQEGIEYVRMMRDNEYLAVYYAGNVSDVSSTAWDNFLNGPASDAATIKKCRPDSNGTQKFCTLDPTPWNLSPVTSCPGNSQRDQCQTLSIKGCTNVAGLVSCTPPNSYVQGNPSGSITTSFTRTITAVDISASEEEIVSTVSWTFHGTPYSVTVSDHLTAWQ